MMNECVTNFDHVYIDSRAHVRARIHFHAYFMYSATTLQPLHLLILVELMDKNRTKWYN